MSGTGYLVFKEPCYRVRGWKGPGRSIKVESTVFHITKGLEPQSGTLKRQIEAAI